MNLTIILTCFVMQKFVHSIMFTVRFKRKHIARVKDVIRCFGKLTAKNKERYNIRQILSKDNTHLDYLFQNSLDSLAKLTVIQAERQIALENLRSLTSQLQTKRLRYNAKSACKYFTL